METEHSLTSSAEHSRPLTLDLVIIAWLHEKATHTGSHKTEQAYRDAITSFRSLLVGQALDLDSDGALVSTLAQGWAGYSVVGRHISPSTYNQRLAILSSFYTYARMKRLVTSNPIDDVKRRKGDAKDAALPLDREDVARRLATIDRSTVQGLRDYALLSVALATGRRVNELADLRMGDIVWIGSNRALLTWRRCKGDKEMRDELKAKTTMALRRYLEQVYDGNLSRTDEDAPVWVSCSPQNRGAAISSQAIADVCQRYLGTSKVHATRHTFALMMEEAGARLSDIGARLGHSNLKTTSDYMNRLHSHENAYADRIELMLGLD